VVTEVEHNSATAINAHENQNANTYLATELAVGHVELAEHVARRERHLVQVRRVPRGEHDAPVLRAVLDLLDAVAELVHALARVVSVHVRVGRAEVSPLQQRNAIKPGTVKPVIEVCASNCYGCGSYHHIAAAETDTVVRQQKNNRRQVSCST
jgi:hypothetical protein